ncbi:MAG: TonB family protein [Undibacterium sp.]|nr:TonB family protein [Undibacterium sp.]
MVAVVRQVTEKELKPMLTFLVCIGFAVFISGCQKNEQPETTAAPAATTAATNEPAPEAASSAPTGLVKSATRHTEETANVTKWWDIAEKKTAAQIARDEKLAKEAKELKLAQEAKQAQEAKILAAKAAVNVREPAKVAVITPTPVVAKTVEAPTPVAVAKIAPPPVQAAPVFETLKFLSGAQPGFPSVAVRAGYTQGFLSVRLFIEKNGSVSKVEIIEAKPKKYFDKEVVATVLGWKYAPISNPQTKIVEFNFKADNF